MGDMGDIATAFKKSSQRHKAMVAEKRRISAEKQIPAAQQMVEARGDVLDKHPHGYLVLIATNASFIIDANIRRVTQIGGKKVELPNYYKSEGLPWLPFAIEQIYAAYDRRF